MINFDSNMMTGGVGGTMMFFGWLFYLLLVLLIVLGIIALWKYISKK
ncbi:hypothetical protein HYU72_01595 [Candidatus Berkelbacteria bacterium]|nr:hypothetical protein [Candidatus Berkelbacteria bacterium]